MALSPEDVSDIKVGRALEVMIATEGWKHFERLMKAHITAKQNEVLQPFSVTQANKASGASPVLFGAWDHLLSSEGNKGAIMGMTLALTLPSGIVSNMTELLRKSSYEDQE